MVGEKKKSDTLTLKHFLLKPRRPWLPLVWEALSKRRTTPGWASSVPVPQRYFRNTVSNVQWWWRDGQDFKARRRLPGELPAHSCAVESRSLQSKLGDGKLRGVKVFADVFLFQLLENGLNTENSIRIKSLNLWVFTLCSARTRRWENAENLLSLLSGWENWSTDKSWDFPGSRVYSASQASSTHPVPWLRINIKCWYSDCDIGTYASLVIKQVPLCCPIKPHKGPFLPLLEGEAHLSLFTPFPSAVEQPILRTCFIHSRSTYT